MGRYTSGIGGLLSASRAIAHLSGAISVGILAGACVTGTMLDAPVIAHDGVNEDVALEFVELAAADDRVTEFLTENSVAEVHVFPLPDRRDVALVVALLKEPVPIENWPFDTAGSICAAGDAPSQEISQEITGVTWLGINGGLDMGVSARFGDRDCYGSVPIPDT